jgi:hypothetical protein
MSGIFAAHAIFSSLNPRADNLLTAYEEISRLSGSVSEPRFRFSFYIAPEN